MRLRPKETTHGHVMALFDQLEEKDSRFVLVFTSWGKGRLERHHEEAYYRDQWPFNNLDHALALIVKRIQVLADKSEEEDE